MASTSKSAPKSKKTTSAKKADQKKTAAKKIAPEKAAPKKVTPSKATVVQQQKPVKKEIDEAFEMKIDELSQVGTNAMLDAKDKNKSGSKAAFAGIFIIILAALAYLFYPEKKTTVTQKESIPKDTTSIPVPGTKKIETNKEIVGSVSDKKTIYTIKYKDQLTKISKEYYGNYGDWKRIYKANRSTLKNPHKIFPGQKIIIPKKIK